MPEIGSQSQSIFAARIAGLWVCPKVDQIEVTENPVSKALGQVALSMIGITTGRQHARKPDI